MIHPKHGRRMQLDATPHIHGRIIPSSSHHHPVTTPLKTPRPHNHRGMVASQVLQQEFEAAEADLMKLKEMVDSNTFAPILVQMQQRAWLLHWSLFVFFNHENGKNAIIDVFFQVCGGVWRCVVVCGGVWWFELD